MRIKYIDVLKAVAIVAVVLYHAGVLTFGYLGVDLFLVIAGYLTTKSMSARMMAPETTAGGGQIYVEFETSRVIRLLPPLLVAGLVCMLAGFYTMLPDDYENLSQSVIATNGFGNNILAAITTRNYWDVSNDYKPLMHTWYVGVLMQFYLFYPILFLLARLDKKSPRGTLLTIISTLAVISLLIYFGTTDNAQRFYYLPSRFFEFAVGGLAALVYKPQEDKPFGRVFVYVCYALLMALMLVNSDVVAPIIRLVAVVALSCVLLCSQEVLENKVTGNKILAKIGAASYSIFIWHQVLLAFYRYTITNQFTVVSYAILLGSTIVLSWLSYRFIEQATNKALKSKQGKAVLYASTLAVFLGLNAFAGYIYIKAGVVRDIPELYISKNDIHRGMHAEYCDRIYQLDKSFETDRPHWLVIGNSFGRDFANVILESDIADSVEVSYIFMDPGGTPEPLERIAAADMVFLSTLGANEVTVRDIDAAMQSRGLTPKQLVVVGTKNFGESNGQFYSRRWRDDYFFQRTKMQKGYREQNEAMKLACGDRYLDMIGMVIDNEDMMPVFTPDHHFISQDCRHLSKGGAKMYAQLIDWSRFFTK